MKRLLTFVLSAALACGLAVPAGAAGEGAGTDDRLTQVTLRVKETLGIGSEYEEFYGELWENELAPTWSLNWSREEDTLVVEATEEGKVLRYSLQENGESSSGEGFQPSFPATSQEAARQAAQAFLERVLDQPLETVELQASGSGRLDAASYRFSGTICLNGLPSPLSCSVTVRASDGKVTRFYRDSIEGNYIGGVPASKPAAAAGAAGALLKGTLSLRLEYVLDGEGKQAVLRYLPNDTDEFYVDAQSGKLVNLTELYGEAAEKGYANLSGGAGDAAAPEAAADSGLTDAELSGIAKLEGVLSKEELDKALKGVPALGLSRYTLGSASYSLNQETGEVTVRMVYSRRDDDGTWRRTVLADAKSGALLEVYSSAPYAEGRKAAVSAAEGQKKAEAFLGAQWGDEFEVSALYESAPWTEGSWDAAHTFVYAQEENGYFFPANCLSVSIDVTDGSISGLSRSWTEDVTFEGAEGIVDEAAALNAWFEHYNVALAYRAIPVKLDPGAPEARPLVDMGLSYFYGLTLSYALESDRYAAGVDAKSGDVVYSAETEAAGISYSDMEGHWAQTQAEALATYGVGWTGGTLQPDKALTQMDLVALLVSTRGYLYDPERDSADDLYSRAYSMGILTRAGRDDGRAVTRGEAVKLLLDSAGYGAVARLQGIFTCAFADRASIPDELMGYAALAQGFGIVDGDGGGRFAAGRTATRAEAAVMLYNFMSR